jgi:hypothetical protein
MKKYPDISPLIKIKEERRRRLASLPFEEKVKMAFSLSKRHAFIKSGKLIPTGKERDSDTRPR